jgi:hypothetical protein
VQHVTYELRISYSADSTLGEGDVRGRYRTLAKAAYEFVHCSAPYRQLLADEDGTVRFLNKWEERYVDDVARRHGWDVEDVDGDAA